MMVQTATQVRMRSNPRGMPVDGDFELVEVALPEPAAGELLVRTIYVSLDPYMRGGMGRPEAIGATPPGGMVGQVLASRSPLFEAGQYVSQYVGGSIGWSSHGVAAADEFRLLDPGLVPLSTALGVVGMPGVTAYVGLFELGKPQPGETVVVSAASGAVGAVVGQLAKMRDCRVVGLAGTAEKCAYIVDELGFDTAINYRAEEVVAALAAACPDGIDIYFDNVGGVILDAALQHLNYKARVPMCGAVSEYNGELQARPGPSWNRLVQTSEAILTGFRQGQFADRHEEAFAMLAMWVRSGALKYREHIVDGLDNAAAAFIGMLQGRNFGKLLVQAGEDPTRTSLAAGR